MNKINIILVGLVLMFGLVSAGHSVSNFVGIDIPDSVVAGNEFESSFSFDYVYGGDNEEGSPLIIRLNVTSEDESYPVWKGDFEIRGRVEKSWTWTSLPETVYFNCSEESEQTINHPLDSQIVLADNGTFYCYNEDGDLQLEEHDEVYLDISSNQALYPGAYNLTAELFYLTDESAPFVNIINEDSFEGYYRELDSVLVRATIDDVSGVAEKWSSVMLNGEEVFSVTYDHFDEGEYYFSQNTPSDITEGDYDLKVFGKDEYGNIGSDSVVLKIDRSAPEIELIGWDGDVASGNLSIAVSVTDAKAGVDDDSVEYRLREMDGTSICPEDGVGGWDCFDSGWLSLSRDSEDLFSVGVETSEIGLNGEYWLQVRAKDVLGNMGVLE